MLKAILILLGIAALVYFGFPAIQQGFYAIRYPATGEKTAHQIDPSVEPVQEDVLQDSFFVKDREGRDVELIPVARYDIEALSVINRAYPRIDVKAPVGDVLTTDLVLVWGRLAEEQYLRHVRFAHQFTYMTFKYSEPSLDRDLGYDYISSHVSSNHLIAANPNIAHGLRRIGKNDPVRIKGYLVNIQISGTPVIVTSTVRTDNWRQGEGNRGGSEFIYVTEMQRGSDIYK